ncbi:BZ3500_MvSof-1268-A1-R1_Chr1-2g01396 [Microbotryum saponariae]|uniref:BZ3500_MvSof-1268-A1-R1_Chr1-2g01396 protein n=1 Tax=Microbotryum saponariae TaxID=289078 RepID=A0A2X0LEG2_9BASI|nr:BZ3500_MvSof-1268-A1-R1_Chr1-2g01396 [Microbotryum saponariae]SCZ97311.1 BZ3501_MvSof-1269-A2-R1_Chr1-2g00995 [Microbotryum saponariae]
MEPLLSYGATLARGLRGDHGVVGLYGAVQRLFITFGLTAGPASFIIDAPFGRWSDHSFLSVNGNFGWLLMELVSPLSFMVAMTISPSSSISQIPKSLTWDLPFSILNAFTSLPRARALLSFMFLVHYLNRAVISTVRNPGRARMNIAVPLSAMLFNLANGGTMGFWISGGEATNGTNTTHAWGLRNDSWALLVFAIGVNLWLFGFVGNVVCDEMLYDLKRKKVKSSGRTLEQRKKMSPRERYSIPKGFLYDYISHPSYFTEWIEWIGFAIASLCLAPSPFPGLALASIDSPTLKTTLSSLLGRSASPYALLRGVPPALRPFSQWYLQPPMIFVMQEILVMLPRAVSGHKWYQATFGEEWPKHRKIVIPGVF